MNLIILLYLSFGFFCSVGKISTLSNGFEEHKTRSDNGALKNQTEKESLPPPPPPPRKIYVESMEKQGPAVAREEDDDIFVGDGVDYAVPGKDPNQSPLSEDMEESPRNKEKVSYFSEPVYGPVPPSLPPQEWQEIVSVNLLLSHDEYWQVYHYLIRKINFMWQLLMFISPLVNHSVFFGHVVSERLRCNTRTSISCWLPGRVARLSVC